MAKQEAVVNDHRLQSDQSARKNEIVMHIHLNHVLYTAVQLRLLVSVSIHVEVNTLNQGAL